jgi:hypothetical protein
MLLVFIYGYFSIRSQSWNWLTLKNSKRSYILGGGSLFFLGYRTIIVLCYIISFFVMYNILVHPSISE